MTTGLSGWIAGGAGIGLIAGNGLWLWLRAAGYRIDDDEPSQTRQQAWQVIPAATVGGAVTGLVATDGMTWMQIPIFVFLMGGIGLSWIDLDVHRIPDRILIVWAPLVAAGVVLAAALRGEWKMLIVAVLGGAVTTVLFGALSLFGSMGLGDVKLAAVAGTVLGGLGWPALITGIVVGFLAAGLIGVVLLIRGASRRSHIAFGPAIVFGVGIAALQFGLQAR